VAGGRRLLGIPQLDGEQRGVDRRQRRRIIDDVRLLEMHIAVGALDVQAMLAQRTEMPAARDERDIVSGLREPGAKIAADATGAHYRDTHTQYR
jgi:hypothetical protein